MPHIPCAHTLIGSHMLSINSSNYYSISLLLLPQDQYIFIHDAILEALTCGDTQVESGDMRKRLGQLQKRDQSGKTGLEFQFSVSLGTAHQLLHFNFSFLSLCLVSLSGAGASQS